MQIIPTTDPFDGQEWNGLKRGDFISIRERPGLEQAQFYRYDSDKERLEVFDQWGVMRYVNVDEYYRSQAASSE